MLLRVSQVARFYGPRLIFKDISMEIEAGSVTLLAGPNGAGKSTLLKIMAGMVRPSSGSVSLGTGGQTSPALGYIGHQTFLYPDLTAMENLRFWAAMHGKKLQDKAFGDILARVELGPFAEEKARAYSRGMAQRLNLARVFLMEPELLLLDEPATGLDVRSNAVLQREIADARARGAGIVWITHSLAADIRRADRVALLENKRLGFYAPAGLCPLHTCESSESMPDKPALAPGPGFGTPLEARGGEVC